jgi:hypothetical protein
LNDAGYYNYLDTNETLKFFTLRVYAHWLPDVSRLKLVDALDDTSTDVTQASPNASSVEDQTALSRLGSVVSGEQQAS